MHFFLLNKSHQKNIDNPIQFTCVVKYSNYLFIILLSIRLLSCRLISFVYENINLYKKKERILFMFKSDPRLVCVPMSQESRGEVKFVCISHEDKALKMSGV